MPFEVLINAERCKACGLCISLCPACIIVEAEALNSSGVRPVAVADMQKCTGCRQCAIICPDAAISIFRIFEPASASEPAKTSAIKAAAKPGKSGKRKHKEAKANV